MANPNKNDAIVDILTSNKEKLLKYLGDFHTDKGAGAPATIAFEKVMVDYVCLSVCLNLSRCSCHPGQSAC